MVGCTRVYNGGYTRVYLSVHIPRVYLSVAHTQGVQRWVCSRVYNGGYTAGCTSVRVYPRVYISAGIPQSVYNGRCEGGGNVHNGRCEGGGNVHNGGYSSQVCTTVGYSMVVILSRVDH